MADKLEQNFAALSISVESIRKHLELNNDKFALPQGLEGSAEIEQDLRAVLAASRREGDVNTVTGKEIDEEVKDEESPYHGRSAYTAFVRAVAFAPLFDEWGKQFPACPNQEIKNFTAPVRALRDYRNNGDQTFAELFPKTVEQGPAYSVLLVGGLSAARSDEDLDVLSGNEILEAGPYSCQDTKQLDQFWHVAFANSWVAGSKTVQANLLGATVAVPSPEVPDVRPLAPITPVMPGMVPRNIPAAGGAWPWGNPVPSYPYSWPGAPVAGSSGLDATDDSAKFGIDPVGGVIDVTLAGTGAYVQRGVVAVYDVTFVPRTPNGNLVDLELTAVDKTYKVGGLPSEPVPPAQFKNDQEKLYEKARKEAKVLWDRAKRKGGELPQEISRTEVERGFIKGAISPRRIGGWVTALIGVGDLVVRAFRDDGKGLDGPLTDAGMDPLGARLAMVGVGVIATGAVILTGGAATPFAIALVALSVGGMAYDTHDAFQEAFERQDEETKRPAPLPTPRAPLLETPDLATSPEPLLVSSAEY